MVQKPRNKNAEKEVRPELFAATRSAKRNESIPILPESAPNLNPSTARAGVIPTATLASVPPGCAAAHGVEVADAISNL
jgi:hypothetical protein